MVNGLLRGSKKVRRLGEIAQAALKHGLGYFVGKYGLARFLPRRERRKEFEKLPEELLAERVRLLLQDLGPTFVKIGQLLSIRPDLVPPEVSFELEKLQDTAPPLDFGTIKEVVEGELGEKTEDLFEEFESNPLASASIGQVHRGILKDGSEVAVKVQRPTAQKNIESDIDLLFFLARRMRKRVVFVDLVHVVEEFSASLNRELDYRIEGQHVDRFRHNFKDDPLVQIPLVYWDLTAKRVLTLEYIEGTKVSDLARAEKAGIDAPTLARHGATAFMKQVIEYGFFHADLHPANVLVTPDGKIAYLDFGMVGELSEESREIIMYLALGVIEHDMDEIVRQSQRLGVEISKEEIAGMKEDLRDILDRYYGRKLGELKIDIIGKEFLNLVYHHHLQVPKDYVLFAKALITVEGLGKQLYPEFNVLEVARPYILNLIRKKTASQGIEYILRELKTYGRYLWEFPKVFQEIIDKLRLGQLETKYRHTGLENFVSKLEVFVNRLVFALLLSSLLVSFSLVLVFGMERFSLSLFWLGVQIVFGLGLIFLILKSFRKR